MSTYPMTSTIGDPIFRAQGSSVAAMRRNTRMAADASLKLNSQERIVSPGDDALAFSTSRRIRSTVNTLKVVQETGQLNITGLGLAVDALEGMKVQLDSIKKNLLQSQVADKSEQDSIQSEIDLALNQIDSAAQNTKLGSRSLLNGESTIEAYRTIGATGAITDFGINQGQSLMQNAGVQDVRVNKIGSGGTTKQLNDGTSVLSLNVTMASSQKATRATVTFSATADVTAGDFVEIRVTGKLGSTTLRIDSSLGSDIGIAGIKDLAASFNALAEETGIVLTSTTDTNRPAFTTVGYGSDEFIKIELINQDITSADSGIRFDGKGGSTLLASSQNGTVITDFGTAATARVNGFEVELGGEFGTTGRYMHSGYDIEIDFGTLGLTTDDGSAAAQNNIADTINIDLTQGVVGLLGATGDSRDTVQYGYGNFTTENLGRGNAQYLVNLTSSDGSSSAGIHLGAAVSGIDGQPLGGGNKILNQFSVADLGTGGRISLESGNLGDAMKTIDRAVDQIITEQTRLGTLQGNFTDAVHRSEVLIGNLSSADADIIGVDAATEITNLVQAQLGAQSASGILAQANQLQSTIFSLLRG